MVDVTGGALTISVVQGRGWLEIADLLRRSRRHVADMAWEFEALAEADHVDPDFFALGASMSGRMIGWLYGTVDCNLDEALNPEHLAQPHAFVAALDVDAPYRRRSAGRHLMRRFTESALESGASVVALRADEDKVGRAERNAFFQAVGMRPVDVNGWWGPVDEMKRTLE